MFDGGANVSAITPMLEQIVTLCVMMPTFIDRPSIHHRHCYSHVLFVYHLMRSTYRYQWCKWSGSMRQDMQHWTSFDVLGVVVADWVWWMTENEWRFIIRRTSLARPSLITVVKPSLRRAAVVYIFFWSLVICTRPSFFRGGSALLYMFVFIHGIVTGRDIVISCLCVSFCCLLIDFI